MTTFKPEPVLAPEPVVTQTAGSKKPAAKPAKPAVAGEPQKAGEPQSSVGQSAAGKSSGPATKSVPDAEAVQRRRRLLARLALAWAVMSVVSEVTPLGYWLDRVLPNDLSVISWVATGLPSITFAVFLFVVASGLRRGRRTALVLFVGGAAIAGPIGWLVAWLLTAPMAAPMSQVPAWFWAAAVVHAGLLAVLLRQWRSFDVRSDHKARKGLGIPLIGAFAAFLVAGELLVAATDSGRASFLDRVAYMLQRAVADVGVWPRHSDVGVPWWSNLLINVSAALLVLVALYLALRPYQRERALSTDDETRLRQLLAKHGDRDSLGYFALRRDKTAVFSPSGKAAVTYRVLNGVSLASGDPIGDVEAWPGAISAWRDEARAHGWRLAVLGASEQGASVYRRDADLDALLLGDEAVVDVDTFDLKGRAMRGVRQAHARIERAGYSTAVARQGDLDADTFATISTAADEWRDGDERGFSMALSRLGDAADPEYLVMQCFDEERRPRAVLGFVPWGKDGLSLDLMRRDRDADNGLFEYMVVELLLRAADLGIKRVSLNFAMFREVFANGSRIGAGPVLRMQCRALLIASKWWQLESLYRANRKYQPSWYPRFICFQSAGDLAAVAVAAGRAEGFLP